MHQHLVLLGDSIFDNSPYVPTGMSVTEHLREQLPRDGRATLLAVDGAVVASTFEQVHRIPHDVTHLFLSVGGNDALRLASEIFPQPCLNVREGLAKTFAACQAFDNHYQELVRELSERRLPLTLLTIYDSVPGLSAAELGGLCLFNDIITRTAFGHDAKLIDLRLLCNRQEDYSELSPIEPSGAGGKKIADAIVRSAEELPRIADAQF